MSELDMAEKFAGSLVHEATEMEYDGDYVVLRTIFDRKATMLACAQDLIDTGVHHVGMVNIDDPEECLGDEHWEVYVRLYAPNTSREHLIGVEDRFKFWHGD
jgi:hypothetical protein